MQGLGLLGMLQPFMLPRAVAVIRPWLDACAETEWDSYAYRLFVLAHLADSTKTQEAEPSEHDACVPRHLLTTFHVMHLSPSPPFAMSPVFLLWHLRTMDVTSVALAAQ